MLDITQYVCHVRLPCRSARKAPGGRFHNSSSKVPLHSILSEWQKCSVRMTSRVTSIDLAPGTYALGVTLVERSKPEEATWQVICFGFPQRYFPDAAGRCAVVVFYVRSNFVGDKVKRLLGQQVASTAGHPTSAKNPSLPPAITFDTSLLNLCGLSVKSGSHAR